MTGTPYPLFSNGDQYLDGKSLQPFLNNPALLIERPVLTAYEQQGDVQCSCFPQYSVRNSRFHYILYTSNNAIGLTGCDEELNYNESELYEIGTERETDPNEWNNLIANSDYAPVVHYLEQFLPDSSLYLKSTYAISIQLNELDCFAASTDLLELSFSIYDTAGYAILPPEGYIYQWTNNLTADTSYGTVSGFSLSQIDASDFLANQRLLIFLQMVDTTTGVVAAIDLKYVYLNPDNAPIASFELDQAGPLQVSISNYDLSGSYTDSWWDFGDGYISYDPLPGPYVYATPGTYQITNFVQYGNGDCLTNFAKSITFDNADTDSHPEISCFPNPADDQLNIVINTQVDIAVVSIYDIVGRKVGDFSYIGHNLYFNLTLDISALKHGAYILVVQTDDAAYQAPFIVIH
jgi:hypothetical protein